MSQIDCGLNKGNKRLRLWRRRSLGKTRATIVNSCNETLSADALARNLFVAAMSRRGNSRQVVSRVSVGKESLAN